MPWVRLDDKFAGHPKLVTVGPLGKALYVDALCYAAQYLTDGFIRFGVAMQLAAPLEEYCTPEGCKQPADVIAWLVAQELWDEVDGGYQIHDYLDYQPSAESVKQERDAARQRMQRRRSGEVREKFARTSPELPKKFEDPVPVPIPEVLSEPSSPPTPPAAEPSPPKAEPTTTTTFEETLNGRFADFADRFRQLDPLLSEGWFRHALRRIEVDVGPLPPERLRRGLGLAHRQLDLRLKAGGDAAKPVHSPRKFAETIIAQQLREVADAVPP